MAGPPSAPGEGRAVVNHGTDINLHYGRPVNLQPATRARERERQPHQLSPLPPPLPTPNSSQTDQRLCSQSIRDEERHVLTSPVNGQKAQKRTVLYEPRPPDFESDAADMKLGPTSLPRVRKMKSSTVIC
ncbi:hypothetical protein AAFF_G00096240 [Aldrovandia affinis]|uniref:Uncharacterized protein n=1 Tax=Aldrovandia affinis TaxID=143900 RepID=A0AAD7RVT1_9TELE|nr:hypothetical protein AAFF_G00096240 [Aldrovandia affinis]